MTRLCTELEYGDVHGRLKGMTGNESWCLPRTSLHSQQHRPVIS